MKPVQTITLQFIRTYRARSRVESAGIRSKVKLLTQDEDSKLKSEDLIDADPEIYELDFMHADETNVMHDRKVEISAKLLPHQIVKSKYFKESEPSFLTYAEKDQIKQLHNNDPVEWTPEKLSQSFPALPHTIKKVLKSHWLPKSVDTIIRYDNKVIENWKNFKSDKLVVSPALKEHLMKFRKRKISLLHRESLEKFIPSPTVLPKPKSNFFSRMIEQGTDEKQCKHNKQLVSLESTEINLITDGKKTVKTYMENRKNNNQLVPSSVVHKKDNKKIMFTDFMKKNLNNLDKISPEEREVLLNTYRKHIEKINLEDVNKNISNNDTVTEDLSENNTLTVQSKNQSKIEVKEDLSENNTLTVQSKNQSEIEVKEDLSENNALTVHSNRQSEIATETRVEYKGLETYVKERKSLMDTNFDYINRIKIPKNSFKKGMTYRIKDCYYDDDGEFLYRTPGLKS